MFKKRKSITLFIALLAMIFTVACGDIDALSQSVQQATSSSAVTIENIPEYSGEPYIALNNNEPNFDEKYFTTESFETYSDLDSLGRCGVAFANVGKDIMPTEERGSISQVKPTAWHSVKYDCVDERVLAMQKSLKILGYDCKREDGYFSSDTVEALKQFESANNLNVDGIYNDNDKNMLISKVIIYINDLSNDYQYKKLIEIMK